MLQITVKITITVTVAVTVTVTVTEAQKIVKNSAKRFGPKLGTN